MEFAKSQEECTEDEALYEETWTETYGCMCRYQNWPILLPTCPHSCRTTWLPLGFFFGFTKSSLNNCECIPTSIYADRLAEDSPYKCDRVTLEPVEVRENEILEFDSEAMQCTLKYD